MLKALRLVAKACVIVVGFVAGSAAFGQYGYTNNGCFYVPHGDGLKFGNCSSIDVSVDYVNQKADQPWMNIVAAVEAVGSPDPVYFGSNWIQPSTPNLWYNGYYGYTDWQAYNPQWVPAKTVPTPQHVSQVCLRWVYDYAAGRYPNILINEAYGIHATTMAPLGNCQVRFRVYFR